MIDERLKNLRGPGRRDFLRWCTAMGAALGLDRAGVLNILNDTAGTAMADTVAIEGMRRFIGITAGNGGFAWFQLIWPHLDVARGTNPEYAYHALGRSIKATNTTKDFYYAPESPFQNLGPNKQITALMSGTNETHTATPVSAATLASGVGMYSGIAAVQKTRLSTLIPVVAAERMRLSYQAADNAPQVAAVPNADGVVQLFSSAASKQLLLKAENARLYEATFKAFSSLAVAKGCPAGRLAGLKSGQVASNVLGNNVADKLTMTAADLQRYGAGAGAPTSLVNLAKDLWTALRLFAYDLSGAYLMTAFNDDPHGAFAAGDENPQMRAQIMGKIFDAFMEDAASIPDPSSIGQTLADNIVFTVHGDTPKNPLQRMGWPDGTPRNSNWVYVFGNGYLKTGWFGGVKEGGAVNGFDPATGQEVPDQASSVTANHAAAAAFHAVTCGNGDVVGATRGSVTKIDGITFKNPITGKG